jgi:hypothetical protein
MSAQTTRAILCLSQWSLMGMVHDTDVLAVAAMPEIPEDEGDLDGEYDMADSWDDISSV